MTMLKKSAVYNVGYTIPRRVLGVRGRPNRSMDPSLRITPGAAEPFEFRWQDDDGVPIGLAGMRAYLSVWTPRRFEDREFMNWNDVEVLHYLEIEIKDPHEGLGFVMLSPETTMSIGNASSRDGIRWGVTLVGPDGPFPCSITSSGDRHGTVAVDRSVPVQS